MPRTAGCGCGCVAPAYSTSGVKVTQRPVAGTELSSPPFGPQPAWQDQGNAPLCVQQRPPCPGQGHSSLLPHRACGAQASCRNSHHKRRACVLRPTTKHLQCVQGNSGVRITQQQQHLNRTVTVAATWLTLEVVNTSSSPPPAAQHASGWQSYAIDVQQEHLRDKGVAIDVAVLGGVATAAVVHCQQALPQQISHTLLRTAHVDAPNQVQP